jgi:hypothetical protein
MTDQIRRVIPGDLIERAQVIAGLRQLAAYLDQHPDVPVCPFGWDLNVYPRQATEAQNRAEVDRIAAILAVTATDQTSTGGHYTAARTFGRITYQATYIPDRRMAAHDAWMSYRDCVQPAQEAAS